MTHQDFNHLFYLFTKNKSGIKPNSKYSMTGRELQNFVQFCLEHQIQEQLKAQTILNFPK